MGDNFMLNLNHTANYIISIINLIIIDEAISDDKKWFAGNKVKMVKA